MSSYPHEKAPLPPEVAAWLRAAAATEALLGALRGGSPASGLADQADDLGAIRVEGIRSPSGSSWLWKLLVPTRRGRRLERSRLVTRRASDAPAA